MVHLQRLRRDVRSDVVVSPSPHVETYECSGSILLVSRKAEIRLTRAEAVLWSLIHSDLTVAQLEADLAGRLDQESRAAELVEDFLAALYQREAVVLRHRSTGERLSLRSWEPGAKRTAQMSVTSVCNLRCVHCFVPRGSAQELSTERACDAVRQLASLGCERINFSGGEVLCHPGFFEVLRDAVSRDLVVSFNTSGTLLDQDMARECARLSVDSVAVSLYGSDAATHENVTHIRGSFERTLSAVRLLREEGVPVVLKTMMLRTNSHQLESIRDLAAALGCQAVFDPYLFPTLGGSLSPLQWRISERDLESAVTRGFWVANPKEPRTEFAPICTAGLDRLAIAANGDVYPCAVFRLRLGNIQENPLIDILESSLELSTFLRTDVREIGRCGDCEHLNYCVVCPGVALAENGTYRETPERACRDHCIQREALSTSGA